MPPRWNRYLVVAKDRLEKKIIAARALEALGRPPLHRCRAKPRLSPLPRFVCIIMVDPARPDDDQPIEMLPHPAEPVRGLKTSSDNLAPTEATPPKSVSYYASIGGTP
jgi:hypothetical protein